MSDIVISGYYGLGNSGDEALLECIVSDLKKISPDVTVTALTGGLSAVKEKCGITTVNRFNPLSVLKQMKKAKLLISGGGTLIQDETSTKSLLYYLAIIWIAKKLGLKVMVYANGIGPIKDKNVKIVEKVLNKVDLITLRENISVQEIIRCNIKSPVKVTADPAFNLEKSSEYRANEILKRGGVPDNAKTVAVSVREWEKNPQNFEKEMAEALDIVSQMGYFPVFIPMQHSKDLLISKSIANKMKCKSAVIEENISVNDILAIIEKADAACGMRLHMLIFASVVNTPMAGIAYDKKIRGFMEYTEQKNYIDIDSFSKDTFADMIIECLNNPEIKSALEKNTCLLKKKADDNARLAIELLNF